MGDHDDKVRHIQQLGLTPLSMTGRKPACRCTGPVFAPLSSTNPGIATATNLPSVQSWQDIRKLCL
jgi:hypothetical protein